MTATIELQQLVQISGNMGRKKSYANHAVDATSHDSGVAHRAIDFGEGYARSIEKPPSGDREAMPFEWRSKSDTPSSSSSERTRRLMADWRVPKASAAPLKLP